MDTKLLTEYSLTEGAIIILEDHKIRAERPVLVNEGEDIFSRSHMAEHKDHEHVCNVLKSQCSKHNNPKYLQKLGIIREQLASVQNTQADHEREIIDRLCEAIRDGQTVPDFIQLQKRLYQDELTHMHDRSGPADSMNASNRHKSVRLNACDKMAILEADENQLL